MNLLVVNDDGWDATGIQHLAAVAAEFGAVTAVAPALPQSGISHQLTLDRPMAFQERGERSYSLDGTPADCVRFALNHLDTTFDWVLSGINHGANLGVDAYISGTVAAAREATFHGVDAIAFSQYRHNMAAADFDWNRSAAWCRQLFKQLLAGGSAREGAGKTLANINLPDHPGISSANPEIVFCESDRNPLPIEYQINEHEVQFSGRYQDRPRTAGRDVDVCFSGNIAVSYL